MSPPVFRFAPSPNGELHIGHARSALVGYDWARSCGGRFLVRLEDIDVSRVRPRFVDGIFEDLAWLGVTWEKPVLRQSEHFPVYRAAADHLSELGFTFPCFASRNEIEVASARAGLARDPDGAPLYPGIARNMSLGEVKARIAAGERYALRLDMRRALALARERLGGTPLTFTEITPAGGRQVIEARPERWGDVVLLRKDVPASYHLCVVVDDARQGVTHVTRGRDLFAATDVHRLLQVVLGLPEPLYHHHGLLTDRHGNKLSKSAGAPSLRSRREAGATAAQVRAEIECGRSATRRAD
jgi:glutamyl-Q tRNA(Asp) synthetase